jgi:hypothetical protein
MSITLSLDAPATYSGARTFQIVRVPAHLVAATTPSAGTATTRVPAPVATFEEVAVSLLQTSADDSRLQTLEVLSDADELRGIREGQDDLARGNIIDIVEVRRLLGLSDT